jgi:hypothetical protein
MESSSYGSPETHAPAAVRPSLVADMLLTWLERAADALCLAQQSPRMRTYDPTSALTRVNSPPSGQ